VILPPEDALNSTPPTVRQWVPETDDRHAAQGHRCPGPQSATQTQAGSRPAVQCVGIAPHWQQLCRLGALAEHGICACHHQHVGETELLLETPVGDIWSTISHKVELAFTSTGANQKT
jgi:hypothetical protein